MNSGCFRQNIAGQLIQVGEGNLAYCAFVPSPLPPKILPDPQLVNMLSEASRSLGQLAGLGMLSPGVGTLADLFVHREAVFSSRIENIYTSIADLYAYEICQALLPNRKVLPEENVRAVLNYVNALKYGLERLNSLPVSLRLIRELHERLMAGAREGYVTPGEFRRTQNWIGIPGCNLKDAIFVPPPVPQMHEALYALEKYLHRDDQYPSLIRLAFAHYQFEAIHPFVDGNGRIGRLLLTMLLVQWQLLPLPLLCLSAYFYRHRQKYYELLLRVSIQEAWQDWVLFFLCGIAEQAQDDIALVEFLQNLREEWLRRLSRPRSSALVLQVVNVLFTNPVLTIPYVQKLFNSNHASAKYAIERLVGENILQPVSNVFCGETYQASQIIKAIDPEDAASSSATWINSQEG